MSPQVDRTFLFESGAVLILSIGIFLLDVLTPLGWAVWLLYFIPLVLTFGSPRTRDLSYFSAGASVLSIIGGLLSPVGGIEAEGEMLNRGVGLVVMWLFTWLMVRQKRAQARLTGAEVARSQADTRREAAVAARELAEASAVGALHRESQTARELLLSSLRLDGIIQSAMDAIITIDEKQRVLLFNQAAERMFCCPVREAIGQPIDRFIPARFRGAHRDHVRAFAQSGVTSRKMGALGTITGLRTDGEEFPLEAAISQIGIEGKLFYTVILRDVSERNRTEAELKKERDFIDAVLETAGALVTVLDREGRILRFNRACEQATGYSSEEVIGKQVWDFLLVPEEVLSVRKVFDDLRGGVSRSDHENYWVAKDKSRKLISWSNTTISDSQGRVDYVIAAGIDVTLLKETQDQLRRTERIAELGTLASGMAHEIGTPMNVILGRAEYLLDRVSEEPIKKGLQTIISQVERITRVMNQLLSFARRRAPERRSLDLRDVVENSVEIFQERLARNRIQVELEWDDRCPAVQADADQMNQVLINLIMNAVHAMPEGGVLRIRTASADDRVMLAVSDTGQGIPPEVMPHIFEPFFTTKDFGQGTGLGLTVVKGILEEHGGSIAATSDPGKGTIFTILLPRHEASG